MDNFSLIASTNGSRDFKYTLFDPIELNEADNWYVSVTSAVFTAYNSRRVKLFIKFRGFEKREITFYDSGDIDEALTNLNNAIYGTCREEAQTCVMPEFYVHTTSKHKKIVRMRFVSKALDKKVDSKVIFEFSASQWLEEIGINGQRLPIFVNMASLEHFFTASCYIRPRSLPTYTLMSDITSDNLCVLPLTSPCVEYKRPVPVKLTSFNFDRVHFVIKDSNEIKQSDVIGDLIVTLFFEKRYKAISNKPEQNTQDSSTQHPPENLAKEPVTAAPTSSHNPNSNG